jgi:hypothetical protein
VGVDSEEGADDDKTSIISVSRSTTEEASEVLECDDWDAIIKGFCLLQLTKDELVSVLMWRG